MSKFIIDGDVVSGSTSYASAISCKDADGNASTVQAELDKMGGLTFGKDGDGNYGYYGADGSLIPFSKSSPFIGISSIGLKRSGDSNDSIYLGCAIDSAVVSTSKYVIWQCSNSIENFVYTTKGKKTPTSLGSGFYEYECSSDEEFIIDTFDNTIMSRNTAYQVLRMSSCKFLPKKPTA